jgi:Yip1 domain
MSLIDRVKNIIITPKTEWPVIATESATTSGLFTGYALLLAVLPVIGAILGGLVIGSLFGAAGMGIILVPAIVSYVLGMAILYLMSLIANALAPSFDGQKDPMQALKLMVYSGTPMWLAGFFAFIPGVSILLSLAGFAYGAYLIYLGATPLMKVPEQKTIGYTIVTILIWIVLSMVIVGIVMGAIVASMVGSGAMLAAAAAQ